MKPLLLLGLAAVSPALGGYAVLLPLAASYFDTRFGLDWAVSDGARMFGAVALALGVSAGVWAVTALSARRKPDRGSLEPDELVTTGPYRFSRNPLFVACAAAGFGLAALLGSPSLLVGYSAAAAAAIGYVLTVEEPLLEQRFGADYREYAGRTPRWFGRPGR